MKFLFIEEELRVEKQVENLLAIELTNIVMVFVELADIAKILAELVKIVKILAELAKIVKILELVKIVKAIVELAIAKLKLLLVSNFYLTKLTLPFKEIKLGPVDNFVIQILN